MQLSCAPTLGLQAAVARRATVWTHRCTPQPPHPRLGRHVHARRPIHAVHAGPQGTLQSLESTPLIQLDSPSPEESHQLDLPGVYAVYDGSDTLQFVGISRKVGISLNSHAESLPDVVRAARVLSLPDASREELTEAWKAWLQQSVDATGKIPPGNAPGPAQAAWHSRRARRPRPELRLTPGKGLQDLTVSLEELVQNVVQSYKVVAFVKGTRTSPQCGFSYKVLTLLNEAKVDYEVVNVLDEHHNPGLRETIKAFSQWPTIPQVYINGEFVGGADILEQLSGSGELVELVNPTS
ncbi:GRX6 [Auxenochlorella protothecoides x Auxenochlorella symbiontica]